MTPSVPDSETVLLRRELVAATRLLDALEAKYAKDTGDMRLEIVRLRGVIDRLNVAAAQHAGCCGDKAEIVRLRGEDKAEIARLRGEDKAEIARLRGEDKAEIARLRGEDKAEIARLRGVIDRLRGVIDRLRGVIDRPGAGPAAARSCAAGNAAAPGAMRPSRGGSPPGRRTRARRPQS